MVNSNDMPPAIKTQSNKMQQNINEYEIKKKQKKLKKWELKCCCNINVVGDGAHYTIK